MKAFIRPAAAGLVASAALAAQPLAAPPPTVTAAPVTHVVERGTPRVSAVNSDYERAVLRQVNRARARHGLRALQASSCLDAFAERRARRLATNRVLVHYGLGAVFDGCGVRSPGHRANVLRSGFRTAAVGAWRASDGAIYVSMVYRAP